MSYKNYLKRLYGKNNCDPFREEDLSCNHLIKRFLSFYSVCFEEEFGDQLYYIGHL